MHVTRLNSHINDLKELVETLEKSKSGLQQQHDEILAALNSKDLAASELRNQVNCLKEELNQKLVELETVHDQLARAQTSLEHAAADRQAADRCRLLETELEEARAAYAHLFKEMQALKSAESELVSVRDVKDEGLHEQLAQAKEDILTLEMEVQRLREQGGKSKHELNLAQKTIGDLQTQLGKTEKSYPPKDAW